MWELLNEVLTQSIKVLVLSPDAPTATTVRLDLEIEIVLREEALILNLGI